MDNKEVKDCLRILKDATSDTEKLASLLLVVKILKAENCDQQIRNAIFDAIGFQFLLRLLKTEKVDEGCNKWSYKSIAVTVLSCFCSDHTLVSHPEMITSLNELNTIITAVPGTTEDETERNLISDTYDCLTCMAANPASMDALIERGTINALCAAIADKCHGWQKAQQLIMYLLNNCGSDTWKTSMEGLNVILSHFTQQMKVEEGEGVFGVCTTLYVILSATEKNQLQQIQNGKWSTDLRQITFNVLQNKLSGQHRDSVLKLVCLCVELLGIEWTLSEEDQEKKFLLLLVHLCCIEVRISLEGSEFSQVEQKGDILCSCYMLLELVIAFMTSGPTLSLDDRQVRQLHSAMLGAFNAVLQFLNQVQKLQQECQESLVTVASVRVLGSWIAEETSALQQHVIELIPFLINMSKKGFSQAKCRNKNSVTHQHKHEDEDTDLDNNMDQVLKFLLPGFCHLSSEEQARKVLISENAHQLFGEYLSFQYSLLTQDGKLNTEAQTALTTLCGVFLNFVVMDNDLATRDPVFSELLVFLETTIPSLAADESQIILAFNMAVLCFMLLRHHSNNPNITYSNSEKLFQSVVTLLWCHNLSQDSEKPEIVPKSKYENVWTEITELWFLGMQALNAVIPLFPSIISPIENSGWVPSIVNMLLKSEGRGVDEIAKESYCGLIFHLCSQSAKLKKVVLDNDGRKLAEMYEFPSLLACLEK